MYWYPWDDTKQELWVREMPDKEYVINLSNNPITTYRYRMHQEDLANSSAAGTGRYTVTRRRSAFLEYGQTNPAKVQRILNKNTAIKASAGLATSSKMSGALRRFTTGAQRMYGMPIICFPMITTGFMIFTIKPGLRYHRCGSLRL